MEPSPGAQPLSGPKQRTMRLLREAARELLRTGGPLTVPAAAEVAGVSRATAYRYFPNNESVVLHATMSLADDPLSDADWTPSAAASADELGSRAADLVRATAAWAFDHETELRTMLRLSLSPEREDQQPRRGMTNRGHWIDRAAPRLAQRCPALRPRPSRGRAHPIVRVRCRCLDVRRCRANPGPGHRTPRLDGGSPHRCHPRWLVIPRQPSPRNPAAQAKTVSEASTLEAFCRSIPEA